MARLVRPAMQTVNPVKNAAATAMVVSVDPEASAKSGQTCVFPPSPLLRKPPKVNPLRTRLQSSRRQPVRLKWRLPLQRWPRQLPCKPFQLHLHLVPACPR